MQINLINQITFEISKLIKDNNIEILQASNSYIVSFPKINNIYSKPPDPSYCYYSQITYNLKLFQMHIGVTDAVRSNTGLYEIITSSLAKSIIKESELSHGGTNKLIIENISSYKTDNQYSILITVRGLLLINKETLKFLCTPCTHCSKKISCLLDKEKDCWLSKLYKKYEIYSNR